MSLIEIIVDLIVFPALLVATVVVVVDYALARVAPDGPKAEPNAVNAALSFINPFLEFLWLAVKMALVIGVVEAVGVRGALAVPALPPGLIGALANLLLVMFVVDFFLYWMHRVEHAVPFLWDEHQVHHSDRHMTLASGGRLHPITVVLRPLFVTVPMTVGIDLPTPELSMLMLVPYAWVYIIHADYRVGFGPFWWLMTSPQYHRIHHSRDCRHHNRNFAVFFPFWDLVFGTAYRPRAGEFPEIGLANIEIDTLGAALAHPFGRWAERLRGASTKGGRSRQEMR